MLRTLSLAVAMLAAVTQADAQTPAGPVYVAGAAPGDLLEVEICDMKPAAFAYTVQVPGFGFLRDAFPDPYIAKWQIKDGFAVSADLPGVRIPDGSFVGVIGVAPSKELRETTQRREANLLARGGRAELKARVDFQVLKILTPTMIVGTYVGTVVLNTLPSRYVLLAFGIFVFTTTLRSLRAKTKPKDSWLLAIAAGLGGGVLPTSWPRRPGTQGRLRSLAERRRRDRHYRLFHRERLSHAAGGSALPL